MPDMGLNHHQTQPYVFGKSPLLCLQFDPLTARSQPERI